LWALSLAQVRATKLPLWHERGNFGRNSEKGGDPRQSPAPANYRPPVSELDFWASMAVPLHSHTVALPLNRKTAP